MEQYGENLSKSFYGCLKLSRCADDVIMRHMATSGAAGAAVYKILSPKSVKKVLRKLNWNYIEMQNFTKKKGERTNGADCH